MIGCLLLGAGVVALARMAHRHHYGWHHGRWARCGAEWHGPGGYGAWGGDGHGFGPGGDDGYADGGYEGDEGGVDFGPGRQWLHGGLHGGLHEGWRGGFRGRFRGGFMARAIAERLEATPAQEKVIRDATDEFREAVVKLKVEGKKTRADVASSFRKSHFDEVLFGELFARHDSALVELRKAFVGMGAHIHDALDDKQRARLAELIEAGPGAWRPRFGRRGAWGVH
jgi:hypothetical protein